MAQRLGSTWSFSHPEEVLADIPSDGRGWQDESAEGTAAGGLLSMFMTNNKLTKSNMVTELKIPATRTR